MTGDANDAPAIEADAGAPVHRADPGTPVRRAATLAVGLTGNAVFIWAWNYGVFPAVLWFAGLLWGSALMVVLNFAVNYGTLRFYDWAKQDWLGIETAKEVREYRGNRLVGRIVAWVLTKGDRVAVVVLSVLFDPFVTTAYLRSGAHTYAGMGQRDWKIFLISFVISTTYWIGFVAVGITAVRSLL